MILYQIAKWMEERGRLLISIRERKGDLPQLIAEKRQIERRLVRGAQLWCEGKLAFELPEPGEAFLGDIGQTRSGEQPDAFEGLDLLRHLPAFITEDLEFERGEAEYSTT